MSVSNICLIGNPNSGKSSLFNHLTGLSQKVSNFPGVTVDKKIGTAQIQGESFTIVDLPGTYSLYPNSKDERIVTEVLTNPNHGSHPSRIILVCDITALERHLLIATQVMDLGIPMVVAVNMVDLYQGETPTDKVCTTLASSLGVPVIPISTRKSIGLKDLESAILNDEFKSSDTSWYKIPSHLQGLIHAVKPKLTSGSNDYAAKVSLHHYDWLPHIDTEAKQSVTTKVEAAGFQNLKEQISETMGRFDRIKRSLPPISSKMETNSNFLLSEKIDRWITHPIVGPLLFLSIMLLVFQAIFSWSGIPMEWIESGFSSLSDLTRSVLPEGWFADLITDGLLAGLGGVLIFIPQITILFFLLALLEESGYMSRAVYLFDPIMRKFGLNGRSMVALISSGACAIPAIMSTRTISNWKERLTTIMVSPLISCSARIPVYTVLVALVVPNEDIGFFNLQGLVFMGLYLLGIIGAMLSALVFKWTLKTNEPSYLMLELPIYKKPLWSNVFYQVKDKVMSFVIGAGKVIVVISIVLWFLASYGPSGAMTAAESAAMSSVEYQNGSEEEKAQLLASKKIEASFAGHMGKWIEPAIKPLGFDWKIGIALITSFAAREVFVGTMATIYSIGSDSESSVRQRMAQEYRPGTNIKVYTPATALSLLVFYVFAMQCMSTIAVTKRETKSWKWPILQFTFMGLMAYFGSLITYQLMS